MGITLQSQSEEWILLQDGGVYNATVAPSASEAPYYLRYLIKIKNVLLALVSSLLLVRVLPWLSFELVFKFFTQVQLQT